MPRSLRQVNNANAYIKNTYQTYRNSKLTKNMFCFAGFMQAAQTAAMNAAANGEYLRHDTLI